MLKLIFPHHWPVRFVKNTKPNSWQEILVTKHRLLSTTVGCLSVNWFSLSYIKLLRLFQMVQIKDGASKFEVERATWGQHVKSVVWGAVTRIQKTVLQRSANNWVLFNFAQPLTLHLCPLVLIGTTHQHLPKQKKQLKWKDRPQNNKLDNHTEKEISRKQECRIRQHWVLLYTVAKHSFGDLLDSSNLTSVHWLKFVYFFPCPPWQLSPSLNSAQQWSHSVSMRKVCPSTLRLTQESLTRHSLCSTKYTNTTVFKHCNCSHIYPQ